MTDKSLNTMLVEYSLQLLQQDMLTNSLFMGGSVGKSLRDMLLTESQSRRVTDPTAAALTGRLRADAGMLRQASNNVSEAKSIVDLANTATTTLQTAFTRMKELANGVATGTMTYASVQAEYNSLASQITQTIASASYNGIALQDGTAWAADDRVTVSGGSGTIEIQSGTSSFSLALYDFSSFKNAFTSTQINTVAKAAAMVTTLSGHITTVNTVASNYASRSTILDSQASSLASQADIMDTAAETRAKANESRSLEELVLDLLLRETGTITDEEA
ncbi:flagellin [Desulfovibrio oxamicus]|uniref:Flagellin n=1 Tax=Nitratidesulfovibrio oxamicus TaxID=32016 RepID=A0ABS0IZA7_9BACT|nr:flagellin [Nitratidesulfovibrio oxamicus]MBG3875474.1 flagellin [Nitratidesulfovibrio oxamicus]